MTSTRDGDLNLLHIKDVLYNNTTFIKGHIYRWRNPYRLMVMVTIKEKRKTSPCDETVQPSGITVTVTDIYHYLFTKCFLETI